MSLASFVLAVIVSFRFTVLTDEEMNFGDEFYQRRARVALERF